MASNKYILRFKDLLIMDLESNLKESLDSIFSNSDKIAFNFIDKNSKEHECQFSMYSNNDEFFFGRYGEIKESKIQNGVALIDEKEYPDADFKYHVQFLIKYSKSNSNHDMVFIYNHNAISFEDGLIELLKNKGNIFQVALLEKSRSDLVSALKKARKIKYISVKKDNNPTELNPWFKELYDNGLYTTEIRISFKKKKSVTNEEVVKYVDKYSTESNRTVAFIGEDGVDYVKSFTDCITFKSKKISITSDDFDDKQKVLKILKESIDENNEKQD